jgi:hypothetical protein
MNECGELLFGRELGKNKSIEQCHERRKDRERRKERKGASDFVRPGQGFYIGERRYQYNSRQNNRDRL